MVDRGFWRGRRVFLTGHTGFKGSWLALWLQDLGAEVVGFSLAPDTDPALFRLARVAEGMRSVLGDIREPAPLAAAMAEARPEVVLHLAAQALVRRSYREPVATYATNVMGTVHLLEAVRAVPGVRAVVLVTTDKCYENREWPWPYREDEAMGGHDPYSSSKGCAELAASAWRRSFFPPERWPEHRVAIASARAGNVLGGGDWAEDRLVPDLLRALDAGRELVLRSPGAVRPWQHVLEPLSGYLMLAERLHQDGPAFGEGWNFGPWDSDARPVGWIVERLLALAGPGGRYRVEAPPAGVHEAGQLRLDSSKARARLGWRPTWGLERGLEAIMEWHRAYRAGADLRATTLRQIAAFEEEGTLGRA
jgi:CDP-glucose 4,6-dehydratase